MNNIKFFEDARSLFRAKENFQNAYNALKEAIEGNISPAEKILELHRNTYFRLLRSFYHLEELKKLKSYSGSSVAGMELTFIHYEELLSSLLSSIDALAYEIDYICELNLDRIDIEEVIRELEDDPLKALLLREMQLQNKDQWYRKLRKQRNIAIHRPTFLLQATFQKKPDFEKDEIKEDIFVKDVRIFEDSNTYFELVESLIANAYRHLKGKIIGRKIMHKEDIKGELLSLLECPYCDVLVAWREKRTPENWPTEAEKKEYDLWNNEKQIVVRSTGPIKSWRRPSEKLTDDEIKSSIVDLEDVVCILEKLPESSCPGCKAEIVATHKEVEENIQEFLKESGYDISLDIIRKITDYTDFWYLNKNKPMLFSYHWRVMKRRGCYRFEEDEEFKEREEIIDEYEGRKVYHSSGLKRLRTRFFLTKEIKEDWESYDPERKALFIKDRDKALSLILQLMGDVYYDKKNFEEAKKFYQKSLHHDSKNAESLLGLGLIEILEGNEQQGVTKCLKAGEISKRCYFLDIGFAFYEKGKTKKAKEWLKKDFSVNQSAEGAYNLAVLSLEQDDIDQCLTWLHKSLGINPEYWDSYIFLAQVYHDTDKTGEAIKLLEKGMEKIIDKDKQGKFFYKNEEKAKEMHSLLKRLKKEKK